MAEAKIISYAEAAKARKLTLEFTYELFPYEMGLTAEDAGVEPNVKVAVCFRPLSVTELGQILMQVKDIEAPMWSGARDELIVQTCLTRPQLPKGAQASMILQNWLPGTISNLSGAIQRKSGYDEHVVKDAKGELEN